MIDPTTYLLFIAASAALAIVPGPTVTVIIANSLSAGARAGLINIAGTQLGLAVMVVVLAYGFASIVQQVAVVFDVIRVIGACYLIWLGVRLWRANGTLVQNQSTDGQNAVGNKSWLGYFLQGFLVIWSNPKALFFFGAFIPQFVDPTRDPVPQVLLLGATFMVVAGILDGAYAIAAGQMKRIFTAGKVRILEKTSGCLLVSGGLWLAFDRR